MPRKTPAKKTAKRSKAPVAASGTRVVRRLKAEAKGIHERILKRRTPSMKFPIRSLANVVYRPQKGYFQMKGKKKERTLTVGTVKTFAQTLRMMAFSKELVETDDIATKREAYYVSKNWDEARFNEQPESDTVIEDVEALFGVNREQLGFIPAEQNGSVAGELIVIDIAPATGRRIEIDCTAFGRGSYSIPSRVESIQFRTKAKFVLAVETAALFERLNGHAYWRDSKCIVIAMGGVPSRANRRFVRLLSDSCKLPVYVFTDGDPYGYGNIYRTMKVGSGNAAHISEYFCVPHAKLLGVTPQDIKDYDLPTHPLEEKDKKRAQDAIKNDPFFRNTKEWVNALQEMVKMGVRVEQQAFAARGLNYVMETYLPEKLRNPRKMLP